MNFVHLHTHSHYSLLDGLAKIDELVDRAKEDGADALALTDHGVMYGAIEFYQKCQKAGIKPIIGVEAYLAPGSRHDKVSKSDERSYHLILLAKNLDGYKNLIKLTTIAHLEGFYYKPRIDWETLSRYADGLIATTACLAGEIPRLVLGGKNERARERLHEYRELFGRDNFFIEVQPHPELADQGKANAGLVALARELDIPLVGTNDIHYLRPEDADIQDVLLCLQTKSKREDSERMMMEGSDYYMKSGREMAAGLDFAPGAAANTAMIAERCRLEIRLGEIQLPFFTVPSGLDGDGYLRSICFAGLAKRYGRGYDEAEPKVRERLDYELGVIKKMGWSSYFLIVSDFVKWAKSNRIVVGPGRGSAAGSLVSYLADITNIDPLKYDLLFERFLNPDRVSMPDIDMDFADTRRDEVIRYVEEKYGQDHVAQIITFGTMAARAAVRDVGRVLGYPYDYCDRLAKMIPMFTKLDQALQDVAELKNIYREEEGARKILDYARRLEGVARHASTHACGVVITKGPLDEQVPLQYASSSDKSIVSQYSLHPIEDLGLLKMDFLGLKNLTIIESAIKIIKNTRALELNIDAIPLDDPAAYRLFQAGETTGVFQFESSGMKKYLKELKPNVFEDIIAMVALYRPGPMEWIPDYIAGKHGRKKPNYLHPKLEPILNKTYGVAIYQEQVMQMARDLAGFTMAEADVLRKAVGKKIAKLLSEQKEKFIAGCVQNGINTSLAEKIFSFIEPFAGYGFNRSHAACYAMIAYQTAYLKAHWPTEFMAALLTSDQHDTDRIAIEIEECRRMNINVERPDINQSYATFTVVTSGTEKNRAAADGEVVDTIRFGLKAIKNIGEHIADELIAERKRGGRYRDLGDLLERVGDKDLNKKSLESLVKSGALDAFGERGGLLYNLEAILNFHKEVHKAKSNGQVSLFTDAPGINAVRQLRLAPASPAARQARLAWEKELLGLYITEHPFSDFEKLTRDHAWPVRAALAGDPEGDMTVAGIITKVQKIITRTSESMLFVKIEDTTGVIEVLVFPSLYRETVDVWRDGTAVICQGRLSDKDKEIKILANRASALDLDSVAETLSRWKRLPARSEKAAGRPIATRAGSGPAANQTAADKNSGIVLVIKNALPPAAMARLKEILKSERGPVKTYLQYAGGGQVITVETDMGVNWTPALAAAIASEFGQNIVVKNKS